MNKKLEKQTQIQGGINMKNLKRSIALAMATVMVFGSSFTVFATTKDVEGADAAATGQTVDVTGDIDLPVIKVVVPTSVGLLLNPYQISYDDLTDTEGTVDDAADDILAAKDQAAGVPSSVISIPGTITNESNVPMGVNVTLSTTTTSFTMATTPIKAADKTKTAFILFSIAKDTTALKELMVGPEVKTTSTFTAGAQQIVLSKTAATKKDMIKLDQKDGENDEAVFTFSGNMCTNLDTGISWKAEDKIVLNLKFSFSPKLYVATEAAESTEEP